MEIKELGARLVEDASQQDEFHHQRGLINELFPYVFEASKRMSSRAISRWLADNGVKLSAVTIAKALREPSAYWEELWGSVEPAARIVDRAHGVKMEDFLINEDLFASLWATPPTLEVLTRESGEAAYAEYEAAVSELQSEWFALSSMCREACLNSVNAFSSETNASESKELE